MIIIGIDENGYGPVLGPLIITASVFELHPHHASPVKGEGLSLFSPPLLRGRIKERGKGKENLWQVLNISKNPDDYPEKLIVTDSKKLFSRNSLKRCQAGEIAVSTFFYLLFKTQPEDPNKFLSKVLLNFSLFPRLCKESESKCKPCWKEISLPLWLKNKEGIKKEGRRLKEKLKKERVKFLGLKSICVCPFQFNRLVKGKSKSYLNYLQFEKLISYFLRKKEKEFLIFADRIGGQRRYMPLLKSGLLKNWNCRILEESRAVSSYELNSKDKKARISFLQNGEEKQFPIALSSLFGKYIREIFMERINNFFQNHNPELKPVSGYRDPLTKNFIKKSRSLRKRLKINEECFLRNV